MMRSSTVVNAKTASPLSLEEWGNLDEDVEGELVDGILEEDEVATFLHELVVGWLLATLRAWARPRGVFVTGSETKIAISSHRGRKPDACIFLGTARPALGDSLVRIGPHVVIEVVSPRPKDARRDRVDKIGDYAKAKAKNYWILDPQVRSLEMYELGPRGRYVHAVAAATGRVVDIPGCEGLILDLDDLWREIDEAATAPGAAARPASAKRAGLRRTTRRS